MTEWISVEEQTPLFGADVLVCLKNPDTNETIIQISWLDSDGIWKGHKSYYDKPTHWFYLPPPPKKKRWMPKEDDEYWYFGFDNEIRSRRWNFYLSELAYSKDFGFYPTYESAREMLDKIKAFVTEQIGEP